VVQFVFSLGTGEEAGFWEKEAFRGGIRADFYVPSAEWEIRKPVGEEDSNEELEFRCEINIIIG
jgi:hypothetical protein